MNVTPESLIPWCQVLLGADANAPNLKLEEYLAVIPRLESLTDMPRGTPVLVRGDVDAKPGPKVGDGDIRLRSMVETLRIGRDRGWIQVVFGHIGRKPEGSLKSVAARLGELLGCDIPLIPDWLEEGTMTVLDEAARRIEAARPGSVLMLENTRKYAIERALWDAAPHDIPRLVEPLAKLANELAEKIAKVYVNEALSAGSLDASTTIVPAAMDRVALGDYVAAEFDGPMRRCLRTELVIFSGLKIDKLDDLAAMIERGTIRTVFSAGSLAMALKKAQARIEGRSFGLGVAEDPAHADKPYYIPAERIDQAEQMLKGGAQAGIEFVLPIDFVLQDGRVAETIGATDQQFDVGPKSSALFAEKAGEFIRGHASRLATGSDKPVVFHNGVFGMFEDPRFERGTREFIPQLKRLSDTGIEVYIGGGEGGTALEKYGQPDWVTHCFTAGGTVLNALGSRPVPYLVSLRLSAER